MAQSAPPETWTPPTTPPPSTGTTSSASGSMGRRGGGGVATALAAVAIVLALVALAVNFVVPGPTGSQGATGQTSGDYWAVVNGTGSLVHGSGVASASRTAEGVYQVKFSEDVANCAYLASGGIAGSIGNPTSVIGAVESVSGDSDAVQVSFSLTTTLLANNSGFSVVAICGSSPWAVVGSNGALDRGSDVVSSTSASTGLYHVVFNQNVENCSYLATATATGTGAPIGLVSVSGMGSSPDGVNVSTWNDVAGTAVAAAVPFQLAVLCSGNWAVVTVPASMARGTASGVSELGAATQVDFPNYAWNCAVVGTLGTNNTTAPPAGEFTFAGRNAQPDAFYIVTSTADAIATAEPFHIGEFC